MFCRSLLLSLAALNVCAHTSTWHVKPEWVRAHEEFLASDIMQGRGSATRDEGIAATYVGTEFLGYGLQVAPGLQSYVQKIEVERPELDGHATITAGSVHLSEGSDFYLLTATGASASGPLQKVTALDIKNGAVHPGSVLLTQDLGGKISGGSQFKHPQLVLVPEDKQLTYMHDRLGGKPYLQTHLKGAEGPAMANALNVAVLTQAAIIKIAALPDTTPVSLNVQVTPSQPQFTYNALALLPGTDPTAGTILISAHLDHLGVGKPVNGDSIYNGADDDASGTTAVMELAHAFSQLPRPKRSVLFVCFGSEELGGIGDDYFRRNAPVPLNKIVANIEFEMIGAQDPKMPKGFLLLTGWDRSNLGPTLRDHGAKVGPDPYPEQNFFGRSDNYVLALKGVIAQTAAGYGTPPYYHQPNDDLEHLDVAFMTDAIQSMVEPLHWLADSTFVPQWNAGEDPSK